MPSRIVSFPFFLSADDGIESNVDGIGEGSGVDLRGGELDNIAGTLREDSAHNAGAVAEEGGEAADGGGLHLNVHDVLRLGLALNGKGNLAELGDEVRNGRLTDEAANDAALAGVEAGAGGGDADVVLAARRELADLADEGGGDVGVGGGRVAAAGVAELGLVGDRGEGVGGGGRGNLVIAAGVVHTDDVAGDGELANVGAGVGGAAGADADDLDTLRDLGAVGGPLAGLVVVLLEGVDFIEDNLAVVSAHAGGEDGDGDALVGAGDDANLAVGALEDYGALVEAAGDDLDAGRIADEDEVVGDVLAGAGEVVDLTGVVEGEVGIDVVLDVALSHNCR